MVGIAGRREAVTVQVEAQTTAREMAEGIAEKEMFRQQMEIKTHQTDDLEQLVGEVGREGA